MDRATQQRSPSWPNENALEDPILTEALTGRFTTHHASFVSMYLTLIDQYSQALTELDARIGEAMEPLSGS